MEPLSRITAATVDVLVGLLDGGSDGTWGLEVIKKSGRPPGTVYPILGRLERAGWVESRWEDDDARPGPRRRLYQLTPDGAHAARAAVADFAAKAHPRHVAAHPFAAHPFAAHPFNALQDSLHALPASTAGAPA